MSAWAVVSDIAAVVTLVSLPYLVVANRRRVPRFSFSFISGGRQFIHHDGIEFARFTFGGTVRNQSLDPNSIVTVYLVVWKTRFRRGTRSFGASLINMSERGEPVHLPLHFQPRESRAMDFEFEIPLTGSHDGQLAKAMVQSGPIHVPKYRYDIAFEDVSGNLFDDHGLLRNRRTINLRWTIDNPLVKLRDGNPFPFLWHLSLIVVTDAVFLVRRTVRRLGF